MRTNYDGTRQKVQEPMGGITAIRKSHQLTQADVCERVRVHSGLTLSVGSLSAIERGWRGTSEEMLRAIELALGMPAESLMVTYEPSHDRRKKDGVAA